MLALGSSAEKEQHLTLTYGLVQLDSKEPRVHIIPHPTKTDPPKLGLSRAVCAPMSSLCLTLATHSSALLVQLELQRCEIFCRRFHAVPTNEGVVGASHNISCSVSPSLKGTSSAFQMMDRLSLYNVYFTVEIKLVALQASRVLALTTALTCR